jgi:hypothetical protein
VSEPLAIQLLPSRLEEFELRAHAEDLVAIPRVLAVEPGRINVGLRFREMVAPRQAARLKFPGDPKVFVLYHPGLYPLARALLARHRDSELWYVVHERGELADPLGMFDRLARERARQLLFLTSGGDPRDENEPLRRRLRELEIINPRPFVPGARIRAR